MTFDQFIHLLAVLAWPAVALILATAGVHITRLLVDGAETITRDILRRHRAQAEDDRKERRAARVAERFKDRTDQRLVQTSEAAMLHILQYHGGFPAAPGDDVGRQLVREVRAMYEEVERPTPKPAGMSRTRESADPDDLTLDEITAFPGFDTDDEPGAEFIEEEI